MPELRCQHHHVEGPSNLLDVLRGGRGMSGMFVHTADVHLGFQKKEGLVRLERAIFDNMMDWCVKQEVDFILMAGDLFHTNIPNMDVQKHAFAAFDRVRAAGIPVYAVYGSHDASPIHGSVIDLLAEGGFLKNVHEPEKLDDDRIRLGFTTDPKTGIKIAGLPGLKVGRCLLYTSPSPRD